MWQLLLELKHGRSYGTAYEFAELEVRNSRYMDRLCGETEAQIDGQELDNRAMDGS
jgi:hypothetical protein